MLKYCIKKEIIDESQSCNGEICMLYEDRESGVSKFKTFLGFKK